MKKKIVALALIASMAAAFATGCSSSKKETEAPATEAQTEAAASTEATT